MTQNTDYDQQALLGKLARERLELQHTAQQLTVPLARVDAARELARFLKTHWPLLAGIAVSALLLQRLRPGVLKSLLNLWLLARTFRK